MPLTAKGEEIMANMKKTYGKKAKQVFYASANKGTIKGVHGMKKKKMKKKKKGWADKMMMSEMPKKM